MEFCLIFCHPMIRSIQLLVTCPPTDNMMKTVLWSWLSVWNQFNNKVRNQETYSFQQSRVPSTKTLVVFQPFYLFQYSSGASSLLEITFVCFGLFFCLLLLMPVLCHILLVLSFTLAMCFFCFRCNEEPGKTGNHFVDTNGDRIKNKEWKSIKWKFFLEKERGGGSHRTHMPRHP